VWGFPSRTSLPYTASMLTSPYPSNLSRVHHLGAVSCSEHTPWPSSPLLTTGVCDESRHLPPQKSVNATGQGPCPHSRLCALFRQIWNEQTEGASYCADVCLPLSSLPPAPPPSLPQFTQLRPSALYRANSSSFLLLSIRATHRAS
jgi:hypothetical protein